MKRLTAILILAAMLLISLCGCSRKELHFSQYTAYEAGGFDAADGGYHQYECSKWNSKTLNCHKADNVASECTVTFNGKEYTGKYEASTTTPPRMYDYHKYSGDGFFFEIDGVSGKLSTILIYSKFAEYSTITEEECRSIADNLAKQYINPEEFEVTAEKSDIYSNFVCCYTYRRVLDGKNTSDRLIIATDGTGRIFSFGITTLDVFSKKEKLIYDETEVLAVLNAKIESIYRSCEEYTYEIIDSLLMKTDEGKYGILYTVSVSVPDRTFESSGFIDIMKGQVEILICLE